MVKNSKNNLFVVKQTGDQNVMVQAFKNQTVLDDYNANHTPENEPDTFSVYVGTKIKELQEQTTTIPDGKTIADVNQEIAEQAFINAVTENPKVIPRLKFETINLSLV